MNYSHPSFILYFEGIKHIYYLRGCNTMGSFFARIPIHAVIFYALLNLTKKLPSKCFFKYLFVVHMGYEGKPPAIENRSCFLSNNGHRFLLAKWQWNEMITKKIIISGCNRKEHNNSYNGWWSGLYASRPS